jgi:hypothetical protein
MGKHERCYERVDKALRPPPWVVDGEHLDIQGKIIWECAARTGQITEALDAAGAARVYSSDIVDSGYPLDEMMDFLFPRKPKLQHFDLIATNPPWGVGNRTAVASITCGLERLSHGQTLALLLPVDFDSGVTRRKFFHDCPAFLGKVALTRRIVWFDGPKTDPKENNAWFLCSRPVLRTHQPPKVLYAPRVEEIA